MRQYLVLVITVMGIFLLSGCIQPPPLQYWEIINKKGKVVYKPPYPTPWPPDYELGIISFEKNGKTGYRDIQGRIIIPPIYDYIYYWDGKLFAKKGTKATYFNEHGMPVAPVRHIERNFDMALIEKKLAEKRLKADRAAPNDDGELIVRSGEKVGLYDVKTYKIMIQPNFEDLDYFEGDLAWAKINGVWRLIDKSGRDVIPPQFKIFSYQGQGLIGVYQNGLWGLINTQGKVIIKPQFKDGFPFADGYPFHYQGEGLIGVYQNGLWGLINTQGKVVISPQFSRIEAFSDGAAAVKRDNQNGFERFWGINEPRYGYIDKSGKFMTPQIYLEAEPFKKGLAAVSRGIAKRQKAK